MGGGEDSNFLWCDVAALPQAAKASILERTGVDAGKKGPLREVQGRWDCFSRLPPLEQFLASSRPRAISMRAALAPGFVVQGTVVHKRPDAVEVRVRRITHYPSSLAQPPSQRWFGEAHTVVATCSRDACGAEWGRIAAGLSLTAVVTAATLVTAGGGGNFEIFL
mmetsp:Transcript_46864/g.150410  ORF Transcript_46864/g.150410 Transcript_46864/m.150410 type:complete len:165 (-) Transcript_46864:10-504(-)